MQTTYEALQRFVSVASTYLEMQRKEPDKSTKLSYAILRMVKRSEPFLKTLSDKMQDLKVELASVDKEGNLLVAEGAYKFSRDGAKNLNHRTRALLAEAVEIEPYICTEIPANLDPLFSVEFEGFVLPVGS